jgi:hypothetical protein
MRRHRTSIASWTALAVVAGGLTVYAIQSTGYPVHKADLDDGGIWVTNQSWGTLGRQNRPVAQLDGVVWAGNETGSRSERAGLDVVQNGIAVASVDRDARTITPVNTKLAEGIDDDAVTVKDSRVVMGGDTIGVAEQATGKVWLTSVDPATGVGDLSDLSGSTKPTKTVGGDAVLTIGTDSPAYPPWFADDDPSNGEGFESAVAYAVALELGYSAEDVTWTTVAFNSAIQPGPKDFDFDVNQFSITEERARAVDFSSPYYDVRQAVVALAGSGGPPGGPPPPPPSAVTNRIRLALPVSNRSRSSAWARTDSVPAASHRLSTNDDIAPAATAPRARAATTAAATTLTRRRWRRLARASRRDVRGGVSCGEGEGYVCE